MGVPRIVIALLALGGCAMQPTSASVTPTMPSVSDGPDDASADSSTNSTGVINGVIIDSTTGEPLMGALVILQSSALTQSREVQSDADGRYGFGRLPTGTYTVQVLIHQTDVSKVTTLPAGAKFRANFSLDPYAEPIICRFPVGPEPNESLFSLSEQEARLLGVPPTKIFH